MLINYDKMKDKILDIAERPDGNELENGYRYSAICMVSAISNEDEYKGPFGLIKKKQIKAKINHLKELFEDTGEDFANGCFKFLNDFERAI